MPTLTKVKEEPGEFDDKQETGFDDADFGTDDGPHFMVESDSEWEHYDPAMFDDTTGNAAGRPDDDNMATAQSLNDMD